MHDTDGRTVLELLDRLVCEVVAASGELTQGPECGLSRLLQEAAATALSGAAAACGGAGRREGIDRLSKVLDQLRRLSTWLDLAERFGDLAPGRALLTLEAVGRALAAVDRLRVLWRREEAASLAKAPRRPAVAESPPRLTAGAA